MLPQETVILSVRLRLRRFAGEDIPFVFSASRHPGFCDGMRWNPPESEEELLEPFADNERSWRLGLGYTFTIEDRATAEPLGRICIRHQEGTLWDLGFWTHPAHQCQGIMTEAARALIQFGFTELGATEIQAAHATWNVASRKVLECAGLKFHSHIPAAFQKNGQWVEEDLLSIGRGEWAREYQRLGNAS